MKQPIFLAWCLLAFSLQLASLEPGVTVNPGPLITMDGGVINDEVEGGTSMNFPHIGGAPEGPPAVPLLTTHSIVLRESIRRGGELYRAGRYTEASQVFKSAFDRAESLSLRSVAGRALGNLGGCQFALHQYRAALHSRRPAFFRSRWAIRA